MPNLDEFDLDPVVSTAENGNDGISPQSYNKTLSCNRCYFGIITSINKSFYKSRIHRIKMLIIK
jgi:hypothetical protein